MCNTFYHWEVDSETGFRRLMLDYTHTNIKERLKMELWSGETRICSTCRTELPAHTYFFASGGKTLHRCCKLCEKSPSYGWGRNYNNLLNKNKLHYCNKCDRILPINLLYFNKSSGRCNKTGFSSNCKECTGSETGFALYSINGIEEINDIEEYYKVCHGCYLELPSNDIYFFKKSGRENGQTVCKVCLGYSWGIQRLNRVLKDSIPNGFKYCYDCSHLKEECELTNSGNCKDCAKVKRKEYNQRPEVKERQRLASQKRRSIEKEVVSDLTIEDINEIFTIFDNQCAYCGMTQEDHFIKFNENLHCEHIHPLIDGGFFIFTNIIPSCRSCNASKGTKDIFEFYDYSKSFTYKRLKKILDYIQCYFQYTK